MKIIPKGSEPANIKKRMDTLFAKLDAAYPDKVICGLQKDHKKWAETVTELYRLLGYPDNESFLNAYGYTVVRSESGRPKGNHEEVIGELKRRYPDGMPFSKISEIEKANPDLKSKLKTIQNNANDIFGMSFKDYLTQQGMFALGDKKSQVENLLATLTGRYPEGTELPKNVAELKAANSDLPMNRLVYIKELYGTGVKEYLQQAGLIRSDTGPTEPVALQTGKYIPELSDEEANEAYIRLLKQRYADKKVLPVNVTELANENPDIPVRRLNKYLRGKGEKKAEHYYIRNQILQGKDTDLMEFTYCMVSFEKTVWELGEKRYAYLAGKAEYAPGDMVVAELGYAGWELGEVKEVIRCLGIDAPWPVSNTKEILRKARPDEIASGTPCLTAVEQKTNERPANDWSYLSRSPADEIPDVDEGLNEDGTIPGFVPAAEKLFQCDSKTDLRESCWVPCEFRFRGLLPEIAKMKKNLSQNGIHVSAAFAVSDQIWEIRVIADEKTMDLIEKFPALKVTGLAEHWQRQEVYVMYSESGFSGITKMQFGGYFDRRHDGGDGRWEWEYDMMEPVNVRFEWMQTGGKEHVFYRYPFADLWNRNYYVRERDGIILVPFSEDQPEYRIADGVLEEYLGSGGDVVIPEAVKTIRASFCEDLRITSVHIPGTVSCVPAEAFKGCKNLKKVTLGEGVERIDSFAFEGCTGLAELILPDSLAYVGDWAFYGCGSLDLEKLQISDSVQLGALYPFSECKSKPVAQYNPDKTKLQRYICSQQNAFVVPDTVKEIAPCAFQLHMELVCVTLPEGLKRIGQFAFDGCRRLQLTSLPDSVEWIDKHVFNFCDSITEMELPRQLQEVPSELFTHFRVPNTSLKKIRLKDNVRIIHPEAFLLCKKLERIAMSEGIEEIGQGAFRGCASLRNLNLPAGIKRIGKDAFRDCSSLKEITIPGSVENIPEGMLCNCAALEKIVLEEGITQISSKAFTKCAKLKEVYLPASLCKKIRGKLFDNPGNVTIRGKAGSPAEAYAKENGIRFIEL